MNKNAKIALIAAVSLAAIQTAGGYYAGIKAESTLYKLAEETAIPNGARFEIRSYDRGVYSSQVQIAVILPDTMKEMPRNIRNMLGFNPGDDQSTEILMQQKVIHGPVIFADGFGIKAARLIGNARLDTDKIQEDLDAKMDELGESLKAELSVQAELDTQTDEKPVKSNGMLDHLGELLSVDYRADIAFSGALDLAFHAEGGSISMQLLSDGQENGTVEIFPMSLVYSLESDLASGAMDFQWGGIKAVNDQNLVTLSPVRASGDISKGPMGLWYSDVTLNSAGLEMDMPTTKFSIQSIDFTAVSKSPDDGETLDINFRYAFNDIDMVTPEAKVDFDSLVLEGAVSSIDLPGVAKLNQMQGTLDEKAREKIIIENLPSLMNRGIRIDQLRYAMAYKGLDGEVDLSLVLPPNDIPVSQEAAGQITSLLQGKGTIQLDENFFKSLGRMAMSQRMRLDPASDDLSAIDAMLDQQIGQMVTMGMTSLENGRYTTNLSLEGDILTINGKPVGRLSQMLGVKTAPVTGQ